MLKNGGVKIKNNFKGLSYILEVKENVIKMIIKNKESYYKPTLKIPKKSGVREIDEPEPELKNIQKKILKNILYPYYPVTENAHGFVKKRSIYTNAENHFKNKIIFRIDITNFFPSITSKRVFGLFRKLVDGKFICVKLTELVTYKNRLPQGAPTSPYISNLICTRLDKRLQGVAIKYGLNYSRYADDIIFSGSKINGYIISLIKKIIRWENFDVNEDKTRVMGSGTRQVVTGLIVNDGIGIGREKYRKIRALINNCKIYNLGFYKKYLMGKISILNQTNYEKWEKMKNEIYSLEWNGEEPVFWTTELKRKNVLTEEEILIPFKILKLIETIKSKKSFIPIHNLEETKKSKEIREMLFYVPHNLNDFIFHISILRKIVAEHKKETIESVRNVLEKMGVYFEKDEGTIRLTNKYIKKLTGTDKDSEITKVWLNIDKIASEFRHPVGKETEEDKTKLTEDQLIRAYSDFDSDYKDPDKDYQELWMNILNSFKGSLEDLDKIISNAENSEINKFSSNF